MSILIYYVLFTEKNCLVNCTMYHSNSLIYCQYKYFLQEFLEKFIGSLKKYICFLEKFVGFLEKICRFPTKN